MSNKDRALEMLRLYTYEGKTLQEIGDLYDLSRERVRQIISPIKNNESVGGASLKKMFKDIHAEKKPSRLEEKCFAYFGCSLIFRNKYGNTGENSSLTRAFIQQRNNAKRRGIAFNFTFPVWINLWEESGHLAERGFGKGKYHMSRICDSGPYTVENVEIKLHEENSKEARLMDKVYNRGTALRTNNYCLEGIDYTLEDLSKKYFLKKGTIKARLTQGLSVLEACTKPLRPWGRFDCVSLRQAG